VSTTSERLREVVVRRSDVFVPVRAGRASALLSVRAAVVAVVMLLLLVALVVVDVGRGDFDIPAGQVVRVLLGGGDPGQRLVVMQLRLPQTAVAVMVGMALGLAGAMTQTFARNPLASPDILGVTDGASAAAVGVIVLAGGAGYGGGLVSGTLQQVGLPLAAFAGGLLTAALLYLLSWRRGIDGQRFVLVGIGVGFFMMALTDWMLTRARIQDVASAQVWLNGSLTARGWDQGIPVAVALVVLAPIGFVLVHALNAMLLGDDTARSLGVRLQVTQGLILVSAVGLAAISVSAVGPLDFVALVVPQVALRLCRASRPPLLTSMLAGACLVVGADVLTRVVLPYPLPAGLVTSVLGAPYLIWLLLRSNRRVSA
jgi:iron complex transport system permease protein